MIASRWFGDWIISVRPGNGYHNGQVNNDKWINLPHMICKSKDIPKNGMDE
jgi:hypothetical protein